jgi:hypothetical protein
MLNVLDNIRQPLLANIAERHGDVTAGLNVAIGGNVKQSPLYPRTPISVFEDDVFRVLVCDSFHKSPLLGCKAIFRTGNPLPGGKRGTDADPVSLFTASQLDYLQKIPVGNILMGCVGGDIAFDSLSNTVAYSPERLDKKPLFSTKGIMGVGVGRIDAHTDNVEAGRLQLVGKGPCQKGAVGVQIGTKPMGAGAGNECEDILAQEWLPPEETHTGGLDIPTLGNEGFDFVGAELLASGIAGKRCSTMNAIALTCIGHTDQNGLNGHHHVFPSGARFLSPAHMQEIQNTIA